MTQDELAVKIFKALGHPLRYQIIRFLADGPRCVCELNADVEFSQSNLSQHLRVLRVAGLITSEKAGLKVIYALRDREGVQQILGDVREYVDEYVRARTGKMGRPEE